jgi:hypothetical protein
MDSVADRVIAEYDLYGGNKRPSRNGDKDHRNDPPPSSEPEPWEPPIPLGRVPKPELFPTEVFPEPIQRYINEQAEALCCPPEYVGVQVLAAAAGAIGASRALEIKPGHTQSACIYAAVIGRPGSTKTPAQKNVLEPLHDAEQREHAAWKKKMEEYERANGSYEQAKRKPQADGAPPPEKPQRPILKRVLTTNPTVESLVQILNENPRGILNAPDELAGWITGQNEYKPGGKGSDRQFWESAWSGAPYTSDRSGRHDQGPLSVRHPFVCVVGGLTPDNLPLLRGDRGRQKGAQDGFVDRILMAYPDPVPFKGEHWLTASDEAKTQWTQVIGELRKLDMVMVRYDGDVQRERPRTLSLAGSGREAWERFTKEHATEINADCFPEHLHGPWSKLIAYCGRFALIIHCLRLACRETTQEDVDGEDVRRAAKLVAYFKSHARKAYADMDADKNIPHARRVLKWLHKCFVNSVNTVGGPYTVSFRAIHSSVFGGKTEKSEVEPVISLLVKYFWLRETKRESKSGRGRPSEVYEVNPTILDTKDP